MVETLNLEVIVWINQKYETCEYHMSTSGSEISIDIDVYLYALLGICVNCDDPAIYKY